MANSQTEDGFVMIALDLFPAIMSAGLSGYAQVVLTEVLLLWAGPRKKHKIYLHGSELAELTGLDRNNARRAIHELVDAKILKPSGDGYLFNKDYDAWTPKAGPLKDRLNGRMIGWIKGAVERCGPVAKNKKTSKHPESTQTHKMGFRESTQTHNRPTCESSETHETEVCESTQTHDSTVYESTQTQRHLEERARDESKEQRAKNLDQRAQQQPHANGTTIYDLPFPDEDDLLITIGQGPYEIPEPDARSIWLMVWKAWRSEKLCREFYQRQRRHKPESWREGIRETIRRDVIPRGIGYVETIAADLDAGPDVAFAAVGVRPEPPRRLNKHDAAMAKTRELRSQGYNPFADMPEEED